MNDSIDQVTPALTLQVSFDIDQDSSLLILTPVVNNGGTDPVHEGERYAGDFYFPLKETVGLQVTGWGKNPTPATGGDTVPAAFSFDIVDCHFITRPKIVQMNVDGTLYAQPSPFMDVAVPWHQLAPIFVTGPATTSGAEQFITKTWTGALRIGDVPGRWEISFLLTVAITRLGASSPEVRVFWFDPEGEVGTGAVIRKDDVDAHRTQSSAQQAARA